MQTLGKQEQGTRHTDNAYRATTQTLKPESTAIGRVHFPYRGRGGESLRRKGSHFGPGRTPAC